MENYAHQACIRCRGQKRKCNRLLPICSRCKRLSLPCRYHGIEAEHDLPNNGDLSRLALGSLSQNVQSHVLTIVGDDEAIAFSAAVFFSTVHPWFPIANRASYYNGLSGVCSERPPVLSLLTLCIHLLGMPPTNGAMSSQMKGLYILATGLVASFTGVEISSLELLQARILLSLFEVGHGMYDAANISMGANHRAARSMLAGLASGKTTDRLWCGENVKDANRVCHGLTILERYIALEMGQTPDSHISNAAGISTQDQDSLLRDLLRASALLEEVLNHIHTPAPYDVKYDEAIPLIQSLVALRDSLRKDVTTPLSCPAMALCRSAFMVIMENGYRLEHPPGKDCSPLSIALLQADVDQFVAACEDITRTIVEGASINIPVFFVQTIGTAALMLLRYFREPEATNPLPSLECLRQLLEAISNRWLGARVYLERIDREQRVPV
ncbi:hypothetical protein BJY00DRAFT_200626 [Aspergillus carlsbadensis]|nr:hypothetical protein BJY00DRAFT_200626 [Aspergillus carlsbadensis]